MINTDNKVNNFFHSKKFMFIYSLLYLSGSEREKNLNIKESMYENKLEAKKWRDDVKNEILSDTEHHPDSDRAIKKLESMYEVMISKGV